MSRFFVSLALSLSLSGAVFAQDAPAPTKPTTPDAPKTDTAAKKIDEQAIKAFSDMIAAYKALKSFAAKMTFSADSIRGKQSATSDIAFLLPNFAKVAASMPPSGNKEAVIKTFTADGKNIFVFSSDAPKTYQKSESAPDLTSIAEGFSGVGSGLLPLILTNPDPMPKILGKDANDIGFGPEETLDGVTARVVNAKIEQQDSVFHLSFAIGKDDNLLRRVTIDATTPQGKLAMSEVYTEVKANPSLDAAAFAFTPPPGSKAETATEEPSEPPFDPRLKVGATPLPFSGKDLAGNLITLEKYKGKVVLVDFWATWYGPCVKEMPNVIAAYNKYHAKGFEIVGVSLDEVGDKSKLIAFIKNNKMPWPQIYDRQDGTSALAAAYKVRSIPFAMLVGKDGKIAAIAPRGPALEAAVKAALAK